MNLAAAGPDIVVEIDWAPKSIVIGNQRTTEDPS